MTPDLIQNLYDESFKKKVFWIDDVYVGILARYIKSKFLQGSSEYTTLKIMQDENILNKTNDYLFIQDVWKIEDFNFVWDLILNKNYVFQNLSNTSVFTY
jgi:hypothetical protein